jgi:hypothetical protein
MFEQNPSILQQCECGGNLLIHRRSMASIRDTNYKRGKVGETDQRSKPGVSYGLVVGY